MSNPESSAPQEEALDGWFVLGLLNEAFLRLVAQPDLPSFWLEACRGARWIVRAQRVCAVSPGEEGALEVVARYRSGVADVDVLGAGLGEDLGLGAAISSRHAGWIDLRAEGAPRREGPPVWLLEDDPDAILSVPIKAQSRTIGAMLYAMSDVATVDQRSIIAGATSYGLYVGATYARLMAISELSTSGDRLQQKNGELERVQVELSAQLDVVRTQHEAMLAMSRPILKVWDRVLALPVIGSVGAERARLMMEDLLTAVVRSRARFTILDLTSADAADPASIDHLLRIVSAIDLLGSRCVVSGISPAMAMGIVELQRDLGGIPVFGTLEDALRYVVRSQGTFAPS